MPQTINFHLDENVDSAIAMGLRRRGIDVTTTADAGLGGATDEAQLDFCIRAGQVMFTMHRDFLRLQ